MSRLVWLIPLFPLVGALANALFGRRIGHAAHWIAVPALLLSFLTSCLVFSRVLHGETYVGQLFPWISAGSFQTGVLVQVDQLTGVMLLVVTGIGFLIHVYSVGYMHEDPGFARFFTYLNLFITAMLVLVLADNLLLLFVGWEGVGLCSYLLIGFWYETEGDAAFILGLFLLIQHAGTLDVAGLQAKQEVLRAATVGGWPLATVVCLLLF